MSFCTAVIVAAGRGRRMDARGNKVFHEVFGRPVLLHAVFAFSRHPRIDDLVVVVGREEIAQTQRLLEQSSLDARVAVGGEARRDSVLAGLREATGDLSLIHDGARPFPSLQLIDRVIDGAIAHGACVPVLPAVDTLRHVSEDGFLNPTPIDRSRAARMQTPQGFHTAIIRSAIEASPPTIPDDASALLASGIPVGTVPGERLNLKITVPEDLLLAEAIAAHLARTR